MRLGIVIASAVAVVCIAGAMVETTNRLTLAAEIAEFRSYEHRDGKKEAEADIASGTPKWKVYGRYPEYEIRSKILQERLHLTLDWFAGCIVTEHIHAYADDYNTTIRRYLENLYGETAVYAALGERNRPKSDYIKAK